jgi:hypothetical protein
MKNMLNRFVEMPLINPTAMFRKELIGNLHGGFVHGGFPEDYELWLRWLDAGVEIQKVPETLFNWHDSDMRLTRTDQRYSPEAFYRVKANYLSRWLIGNKHQSVYVWGAGRVTRKRVALLHEKGINIEGYIDVKERNIEGVNCYPYNNFDWGAQTFIISYVGNRGAREEISNYLISKGKKLGRDFLTVA